MMTFSTFHKVFINVITNIFHRSFKLILLSAVIPSRSTRICQIEKERDVAECLGVCVYLGVCTHTHVQQGVDCLRVSKVSLHEASQKTSIPPLLPVKTVTYHSISSLPSTPSFYIPPFSSTPGFVFLSFKITYISCTLESEIFYYINEFVILIIYYTLKINKIINTSKTVINN